MANSDIPPDFLKGCKRIMPQNNLLDTDIRSVLHACPECRAVGEPEDGRHRPWCSRRPENGRLKRLEKENIPVTILDLAFTIQDPCGTTAIELAREVLKLISDREDQTTCENLLADIHQLNSRYRR